MPGFGTGTVKLDVGLLTTLGGVGEGLTAGLGAGGVGVGGFGVGGAGVGGAGFAACGAACFGCC